MIEGEKKKFTELSQEEKDLGAKAQETERRAEELRREGEKIRMEEAQKKEEKLEAGRRVEKHEEEMAMAKEIMEEMLKNMNQSGDQANKQ